MQTLKVKQKLPVRSEIHATRFDVDPEFDDLNLLLSLAEKLPGMAKRIRQRLLPQLVRLRERYQKRKIKMSEYPALVARAKHNARQLCCHAALMAGEVKQARPHETVGGENTLLRGFWEDLFARFGGSPGGNQTLEIKYLALGTSYAESTFSQEDLTNETYRDVPTDKFDDGLTTYYQTIWTKRTQANPLATTLSAHTTGADPDMVTLTSTTGAIVGAQLQVETASAIYIGTISAVDGSDVTLSGITGGNLAAAGESEFDSADYPQSGDDAFVLISEGGCIIGDDATTTLETGKAMNRKRLARKKTTSDSLLWNYIVTGASVE